jgi:hypothetical protein
LSVGYGQLSQKVIDETSAQRIPDLKQSLHHLCRLESLPLLAQHPSQQFTDGCHGRLWQISAFPLLSSYQLPKYAREGFAEHPHIHLLPFLHTSTAVQDLSHREILLFLPPDPRRQLRAVVAQCRERLEVEAAYLFLDQVDEEAPINGDRKGHLLLVEGGQQL